MTEGKGFRPDLMARRREVERTYKGKGELKRYAEYGSPYQEYDYAFREIFPEGFLKHLQTRFEQGKSRKVLDVMAPSGFLRSLAKQDSLDAGLAVTLDDYRAPGDVEQDRQSNIEVVDGDILSKKTWRKIDQWVAQHAPDGLDVVVSRAIAGLNAVPNNPDIRFHLLNRLWQLVSEQDGMLIAQVPQYATKELMAYQKILQEVPGLKFQLALGSPQGMPIIRMERGTDAPNMLPALA